MVRSSVAAAAACIAFLLGSAAHAQQTPAPAAPPPPGYGEPITLEQANKAVAAAMAESKKNG